MLNKSRTKTESCGTPKAESDKPYACNFATKSL